jgi:ubiquinone/menaquinone biosynthesis C-methylase UbiE
MINYLDRSFDLDDPQLVSTYDEVSLWSAHFGMLMLRYIELRRDIDGLDVGCGTGFPLFELAQLHGLSCRFTGVDVWRQALDRAAQKLQVYGLPNVRLLYADAANMPLPDASFDLIVSNIGLNNFERPEAALAECARVARPGARLVLTTNVQGHMTELYDLFRATLAQLGHTQALERLAAHEAHRSTQERISALLEGAGFHVTRVITDAFQMRFLDGNTLLRHWFIGLGFLPAWRAVIGAEHEYVVFPALEQRLNELAAQRGELSLTVPMLYVEGRKR